MTLPAGDDYVVSGRVYGGLHLERFETLGRIRKENKIEQFHSIYLKKVVDAKKVVSEALCHVPRFSLTLPAGDNYVVSGRVYGRGRIAFRTIRNTGPLFQGEQNRTISQHLYIKSTSKSHETVAGLNPADPDVSIL